MQLRILGESSRKSDVVDEKLANVPIATIPCNGITHVRTDTSANKQYNIQTMERIKDRDLTIPVIFTRKSKYYDDDDNDVYKKIS